MGDNEIYLKKTKVSFIVNQVFWGESVVRWHVWFRGKFCNESLRFWVVRSRLAFFAWTILILLGVGFAIADASLRMAYQLPSNNTVSKTWQPIRYIDTPKIAESCKASDCSKIYSQYELQYAVGRNLGWAFDETYYGAGYQQPPFAEARNSKEHIKHALTVIRHVLPCQGSASCPHENVSWTEQQVSEAEKLLQCILQVDDEEYDLTVRRTWEYSKSAKGLRERAYVEERDGNFHPSVPVRSLKTGEVFLSELQYRRGSEFFVSRSVFKPCANLPVSDKTLSNLRMLIPKRYNDQF